MARHAVLALLVLAACSTGGTSPDGGDASAPDAGTSDASDAATFDPSDAMGIPKWVTALPIPPVYEPRIVRDDAGSLVREEYDVTISERVQQVLPPGYPPTKVWAYGAAARRADGMTITDFAAWPGGTFEATRGVPVRVTWRSAITGPHMFPVDPTLHWADPNDAGVPAPPFAPWPGGYASARAPVPFVTHLHGAEVPSTSDGHPLAWFTADGRHGASYASVGGAVADGTTDEYPNTQRATTLWYHDHALGLTRLNVMAGLAGFYLLRDPADAVAPMLPSGAYEIPIVIQDRSFERDGSLSFPTVGTVPDAHPYWTSEFFGDVVTVNGAAWPNVDVEPRSYRLRLLNGSNARFYDLRLVDDAANEVAFVQVGTDGGYLPAATSITHLVLAPGERADVLVDFSTHVAGKLRFVNRANAPYPGGEPPDPLTVGQVLQFSVVDAPRVVPVAPPPLPPITALVPDSPPRFLTLVEVDVTEGPLVGALNGQMWQAPVSEMPRVGATEEWVIANLTEDAHPIHLHLVEFQFVSRQPFRDDDYLTDWRALNSEPTFPVDHAMLPLDPTPYLYDAPELPAPNERGWKDTLVVMAGMVTRLRVRFAPQDAPTTGPGAAAPGTNLYTFDPSVGAGYVWHCHILDHEDNEMMRPYTVAP